MLKLRLQRIGRKHDPSFRLILTDSRKAAKSGSCVEMLGFYNARYGEPQFKKARIAHWLSKGARISDTVHNLLVGAKIIEAEKKNISRKNIKKKK